jgi:HSP20 family protein
MKEPDTFQDMRSLFIKMLEDTSKNVDSFRSDIEKSVINHAFIPLEGIEETDDSIIVRVVLPGVKKEDVDISVTEAKLKVKANFDFEQSFKGMYLSLSDIKKGKIKRTIKLPEKVIPESAVAKLENGILKVDISKQEKDEKFKVEID